MTALLARDKALIWHPYTQHASEQPALPIARANGSKLYLEDGRELIDGISSWWVNLHGHCHPHISRAVEQQLKLLHHVIFAGCTHEPAVRLAEALLKLLPAPFCKVFYTDNGSTAVECALKMAIQFAKNSKRSVNKIIALDGAYHGDTFGAMSVAGRESGADAFFVAYQDFFFDVHFIKVPTEDNRDRCISEMARLLEQGNVAAFIFEPLIQAASGMHFYSADVLDELVKLCAASNVITIADEVFTGFGRSGKNFAIEHLTSCPDIICLSKGITGGTLPLAATCTKERIYQGFLDTERRKMLVHGHSYTANPLACAAANASLELLSDSSCQSAISRISTRQAQFAKQLRCHSSVQQPRAMGTVFAVDINPTDSASGSYFGTLRDFLYNSFIDQGILLRPLGNVVYVVPPYCITDAELDLVHWAILNTLEQL